MRDVLDLAAVAAKTVNFTPGTSAYENPPSGVCLDVARDHHEKKQQVRRLHSETPYLVRVIDVPKNLRPENFVPFLERRKALPLGLHDCFDFYQQQPELFCMESPAVFVGPEVCEMLGRSMIAIRQKMDGKLLVEMGVFNCGLLPGDRLFVVTRQ